MSLSDLKKASAARMSQEEPQVKPQVQAAQQNAGPIREVSVTPRKVRPVASKPVNAIDGRTKMLGARVPLTIHRELQQQIFRAQENFPDLTIQEAIPALIRLLRDEKVWTKFMSELEQG